ncbi:MAG: hypothetical protein ACYC3L_11385 [Gemmatimonadaceae bacterium]
MPYTNCASCGAKALVGATRCPRCEAPFVSYDVQGKRVPTVNCPECGVQRPAAIGACPNCFTSASHSSVRVSRGLIIAGLAIAGIITVGYFVSRTVPPTKSQPERAAVAVDSVARVDSVSSAAAADSVTPDTAARNSVTVVVAAPVAKAAPRDTTPLKPVPQPIAAVADTGIWVSAVANTWVRVRSAPSRESETLRMIDSAQRVRLGPPVYGWRPVKVGVDRGWVDPRFFTVVPPRL